MGEDVQKWKSSGLAGGKVKWAIALEKSLAVPEKVQHRAVLGPSNAIAREVPKEMKMSVYTKA